MSAAWTKKAGKNPAGGLNAKGRASYHSETGGTFEAWGASSKADAKSKAAAISKRNKR